MSAVRERRIVTRANAVVDAHIPSLTNENEDTIRDRATEVGLYSGIYDEADLAIRTCSCGVRVDGFYEYVSHLKGAMRAEL